jgi:hypothetical protein
MVKIIFCSRCGNPMAMTPENLAEREAIREGLHKLANCGRVGFSGLA